MPAPIPVDDEERIQALESYAILRTRHSAEFYNWAAAAQAAFHSSFSAISLVERDQQWFKASCGLDVETTTRDVAFCAHTILYDSPLVVEDALLDPRFRDNGLVTGPPHIRFYAGAPLITQEGFGIGALCVFDPQPMSPTPAQLDVLTALRDRVMIELELRRLLLGVPARDVAGQHRTETARERDLLAMYLEHRRDRIGGTPGAEPAPAAGHAATWMGLKNDPIVASPKYIPGATLGVGSRLRGCATLSGCVDTLGAGGGGPVRGAGTHRAPPARPAWRAHPDNHHTDAARHPGGQRRR